MENLCTRFPHLAGRIFDQVDDESLNNCKEISREVLEFLDNERFFWIRIIKKPRGVNMKIRLKDFPKSWKPVIEKTPVEKVKQIAIAVSRFFQENHLYYNFMQYNLASKFSLIVITAHHGDLALLQFIVNKIKLKNFRQTDRMSALHMVASEGHVDVYDLLTSKLRDKNPGKTSLLNRKGQTPLHRAAENGHFAICKLIIEGTGNKNPGEIKEDKDTPLHLAAANGHLEVCKLILNKISDKNPANWSEGKTPLHFAAENGHLAVCQLMIENLSDINPNTTSIGIDSLQARYTPLHLAAESGHVEVCKLLMENLVDKNPRCSPGFGDTPLHFAAESGHLDVCKLIMDNITDKNPATGTGLKGQTPFHYAAKKGQLAVCRLMLETLSDKNPTALWGYTPLHFSAESGHVEVCKLIMENLVDKNPSTPSGITPLCLATEHKKSEVCQIFHEYGIHSISKTKLVKFPIGTMETLSEKYPHLARHMLDQVKDDDVM